MKINLTIGPKHASDVTDIQNIEEKDNSILVHWKAYPGGAHVYTDIQKDVIKEWYEKYGGGSTPDDFDLLLEQFNTLLTRSVLVNSTTYNYLKANYEAADYEWNYNSIGLFSSSTYPEVYPGTDYRGNNNTYETLSYKAMQAWLMAMELSELVPTSGTSNNTQTKLFKKAYEIGGGKEVPIYSLNGNGYTLKGDIMVARLAAGAIYAINHDRYRNNLSSMRLELGGSTINASDWNSLGYTEDSSGKMTACGYLVNTDAFLPNAPGPFATGYPESYPSGQNTSLFYDSTASPDWKRYNYKVDIAIDDYMTENYRLFTETSGSYYFKVPTNSIEKEVNKRVIEAATIPLSTDFMYFGKKRIKYSTKATWPFSNLPYVGVSSLNVTKFFFEETADAVSDTNNVYDIEGPFSSLQNIMFNSPHSYSKNNQTTTLYNKTSHMIYLSKVMNIADNSRFTTMYHDYGRRRPLGGLAYDYDARVRNKQEDPLNGFSSGSLTCLFADTTSQVDYNSSMDYSDDFPHDKAKSYMSGHSAQAWTLAMYLGQMKPESIIDFMKNAYRFSVNRSVGRYHWNSDCIYGRLFGTMCLPILNAMNGSGWQSSYESLKDAVNGGGGSDYIISVNIRVKNNRTSTTTLDGDFCFVLKNPDEDGRYVGWTGLLNRTDHIMLQNGLTLSPGEERTFTNISFGQTATIYDANGNIIGEGEWGLGRRRCLDPSLLSQAGRPRNVLVYVGGDSEVVLCDNMDPNVVFVEGGTYTITLTDATS